MEVVLGGRTVSEQWKATSASSVTLVTVRDSAVMSRRRGVGVGAIKKRAEDAKAFANTGKKMEENQVECFLTIYYVRRT